MDGKRGLSSRSGWRRHQLSSLLVPFGLRSELQSSPREAGPWPCSHFPCDSAPPPRTGPHTAPAVFPQDHLSNKAFFYQDQRTGLRNQGEPYGPQCPGPQTSTHLHCYWSLHPDGACTNGLGPHLPSVFLSAVPVQTLGSDLACAPCTTGFQTPCWLSAHA